MSHSIKHSRFYISYHIVIHMYKFFVCIVCLFKILGKNLKVQFIWHCEMRSAEVMLVLPKQFCQNLGLKKNSLLTWHPMVPPHCCTGIDLKSLTLLLLFFIITVIIIISACEVGKKDLVKMLLDHKADGRIHPITRYSPLYVVAFKGKKDVFEILLKVYFINLNI